MERELQFLIAQHLQASMQYLLIATRFNDWTMDRKGFHAFYSKMSDDAYNDAVTLMKHMNMRGGILDNEFKIPMPEEINFKVSELESLSLVLAIEKDIVKNTLTLINNASNPRSDIYHADGEIAFFLAEQVSEKHTPRIKTLAAHVNNLGQAISQGLEKNKDPSYVVYLYDTQFM
jgi:ferritin